MAILTSIESVIAEKFSASVAQMANRQAHLLAVLPKRMTGGSKVSWVYESTGSTPALKAVGADFDTGTSDTKGKASAEYSQQTGSFGIADRIYKTAKAGVNPEEFIDAFGHELGNSVASLIGDASLGINHFLFTGTGASLQPFGLVNICRDDNTDLYGVDQTSVTTFQSNVVSGGSGALSFDMFQECFAKTRAASGMDTDLIVCSPTSYFYVEKLYTADKTFMSNMSGGIERADLGWYDNSLRINGAKLIWDKDAPDGYFFGLNTQCAYLAILPQEMNDVAESWVIPSSVDPRSGMKSLPISISGLARTGTAKSYGLVVDFALIVERPNTTWKLHLFTEPS